MSNNPMTPRRLAEIKARYDAVPKGVWAWRVNRATKHVSLEAGWDTVMQFVRWGMQSATVRFPVGGIMEAAQDLVKPHLGENHHFHWNADIDHPVAQFITHAHADVPDLYAEVERLQAEVERFDVRKQEMNDAAEKHAPKEYQRGLDEGSSCQAILEIQGRERFMNSLTEKEIKTHADSAAKEQIERLEARVAELEKETTEVVRGCSSRSAATMPLVTLKETLDA